MESRDRHLAKSMSFVVTVQRIFLLHIRVSMTLKHTAKQNKNKNKNKTKNKQKYVETKKDAECSHKLTSFFTAEKNTKQEFEVCLS